MHDFDKYLKTIKAGFTVIIILAVFLPLLQFTSLSKDKKQENLAQFAKLMEEQQRLKDEKIALEHRLQASQENLQEEIQQETETQEEEPATIKENREPQEEYIQEEPATIKENQEPQEEYIQEEPVIKETSITKELVISQEEELQKKEQEKRNTQNKPMERKKPSKNFREIAGVFKRGNVGFGDIERAKFVADELKKQNDYYHAVILLNMIYATTNKLDDFMPYADTAIDGNIELEKLEAAYKQRIKANPQDAEHLIHLEDFFRSRAEHKENQE